MMKHRSPLIELMVVCLVFLLFSSSANAASMTPEVKTYFNSLYRDTWRFLSQNVDALTGLPYDSNAKQPPTSMSNIGLYLASVSIAYRTGLISKQEAGEKVEKCLESLERVPTWRGFPVPWIIVKNLKQTNGDSFSYGPHIANLIAGLIVAKNTFTELDERIQKILLSMDFHSLYDRETGWLKGGYNLKTKNFEVYQPWGHWYYKFFASEARLLTFYVIARQLVPPDYWYALVRPVMQQGSQSFLASGYEDAGLGTPFIAGLFLDERETEMGASQRSQIKAQMEHAQSIKSPVWGWAASESPMGRYLAAGELRDEVIAPYASILAALYFPNEAYSNLKKLEELGARPANAAGEPEGFGFRDSVNWKSGQVSKHQLALDQSLAFLSLANLIHDGAVWQAFGQDPTIQKGFQLLHILPQLEYSPKQEVAVH